MQSPFYLTKLFIIVIFIHYTIFIVVCHRYILCTSIIYIHCYLPLLAQACYLYDQKNLVLDHISLINAFTTSNK